MESSSTGQKLSTPSTGRPSGPLPMSSDDWRDALPASLALGIALLGSRLVKMLVTLRLEDQLDEISGGKRLLQAALLLIALLVTGAAGRWLVRRGVKLGRLAAGAAVLVCLLFAAMALRHALRGSGGSGRSSLLSRAWLFATVFRADLTFTALFAAVMVLVCSKVHGPWRFRLLALLRGFAALCATLAGLELGYFRSTGMLGDGFIVKYWISNFRNVAFIVRSELDPVNLFIVAAGIAIVPALVWMGGRRSRWFAGLPAGAASLWVVPAAALALWALPANARLPSNYSRLSPLFPVTLVTDLVSDPYWSVVASGALDKKRPPLADTRHLAFAATPTTKPLNVVFVIMESTRARSVTPYNPAIENTPFLAELARKSLVADDMYAVIPHTARAWTAILTGLYPVTSAVATWSDADAAGASLASVPRLLGAHGYASAFFTPAHLKFEKDASLIHNRGFDVVHSDGDYDTAGFERTNYFGYEDRIMLAPSLKWVDQARAQRRPFFLTYMTLTGHHDYQVPTSFPKVAYPGVSDTALNDYLNALHYVDTWLRDLFAAFEQRHLLESTVFVILGDHGESFGEHGPRQHIGVLYEEAVKIPLLIHAPGLAPGRITGLRQQIDVLPTVADILGYQLQDGFVPGLSLLRPVPAQRTLYFTGSQENLYLALRRGKMKYIYFFRRAPMQAFDLDADPGEREDRAGDLTRAQSEAIEQDLFAWRQSAVDVFLHSGPSSAPAHAQAGP
jgi:lipoteichoic acid synthase